MPRGRVLDVMERSAIKVLKRRGLTDVAIAQALGCHRTTVAAAVTAPLEVPRQRDRSSAADAYQAQIETWLTRDVPVRRMRWTADFHFALRLPCAEVVSELLDLRPRLRRLGRLCQTGHSER